MALTPKELEIELKRLGFTNCFDVVSCVNVWSNGKVIRRYQGQDKSSYTTKKEGTRKMMAILIEVPEN